MRRRLQHCLGSATASSQLAISHAAYLGGLVPFDSTRFYPRTLPMLEKLTEAR